ncbi:arginase family protein [Streptomyces sp. NPDC086989]|uniref:arginase family protein n=1 Tax=Streptomyces sp. NPDC086989 TaxID=3365764 RepID=UPI0038152134
MPKLRTKTGFAGLRTVAPDAVPPDAAAAVVGSGYSLGSAHEGAENGPFFLRTLSRAHTWGAERPGIVQLRNGRVPLEHAVDIGDVLFDGMALGDAQEALAQVIAALPAGTVPAVIGGDHTVTLPVVEALWKRRRRPFTVVQFDHHLDVQIWDGAPTWDVPREPIFNTNVMSHVSDLVGHERLLQIGVAPYATVEADSADGLDGYLHGVGRQLPLLAPELDDPEGFRAALGTGTDVYLTVDIDVLDRSVMSSTGYPAEAGLGTRDLLRLIDWVLRDNRLVGFDLVEFAAPADARDATTLSDASRAVLVFLHLLNWACRQAAERA